MTNLNLNLALKTTKKISKLWVWKTKTLLVGVALIVSWVACLKIGFELKKYNNITNLATTTPAPTKAIVITNNGSSNWSIFNPNFGLYYSNPNIDVKRGLTYAFNISSAGHPFWIKTNVNTGTGNAYSTGITNNGIDNGTLTFTVPFDAPSVLYYVCQFHDSMVGVINCLD